MPFQIIRNDITKVSADAMLTADLLNLSPDEYMRLKKRMTQITDLAKENERKWDVALWWKLNEKMDALCQKLRRYQVFRLLLDEDEDAFFSAIREITEQFSVFPTEDQAPTAEAQKRQFEHVANQFSQRGEYAPLDLFHPSEADLEDGVAFYYEMLRAFGPTKGAWRDYQKRLDRAMRCTFMTSAPSTALFGISSGSVCPS